MNLKSLFGNILWWLAVAALIGAWIASGNIDPKKPGVFLNIQVAYWFWDALILGILSLGLKASAIISHLRQNQKDAVDQLPETEKDMDNMVSTKRSKKVDAIIK